MVLCTFILQLCRAFELSANDMRFSGENNADSSCLFGAAAPRQAFKPLHSCTTVSGVEWSEVHFHRLSTNFAFPFDLALLLLVFPSFQLCSFHCLASYFLNLLKCLFVCHAFGCTARKNLHWYTLKFNLNSSRYLMHFDSQNQCFLIFLIVLYCNFSLCICCLAALLFTTPPPSFSLSPAQLRLALCYVFCCCICCRKILLLHFIYKSGTAPTPTST